MNVATLDSAPVAGSRAGRYLFLRQVTSSFVGSLWESRCEAERQLLALARVVKLPGSAAPEVEQSLAEAAWDSMELDDDSVIRVADAVFGTGWFALVHDYYDGDTLATMQRRVQERKSAVPVAVALRIVLDAARAVEHVGEAIKNLDAPWQAATVDPGSLFVCDDGRTRVLDGFVGHLIPGIPKMAKESDALAYAAPEQFSDLSKSDERSHVFRLGVIAWELLTSKRLLVGSKQVMQRRLESPIVRVDKVVRVGSKASEAVARVVERALNLDPSRRFQNVKDFASALGAAAEQVAEQQDVIQFADALVGRESTLASLVMDKPERLSDTIKSVRPTADVAKSFAAHVRTASGPADGKRQQKPPPASLARAPDALFSALPRLPAAPQVAPPDPARRTAPPPMPHVVASAQAALGRGAGMASRQRMKTLVGLADEFVRAPAPAEPPPPESVALAQERPARQTPAQGTPAQGPPVAKPARAPTPKPFIALAVPAPEPTTEPAPPVSETPGSWDETSGARLAQAGALDAASDDELGGMEDLEDEPTTAYGSTHLVELAQGLRPRKELESGPRLASRPPPPPMPVAPSAAQPAPEYHWTDPAPAPLTAGTPLGAAQPGANAAAPEPVSGAEVQPQKRDRRLLVLALFFAGTTLVFASIAASLFFKAETAEDRAAALVEPAAAPAQAAATVEAAAPVAPHGAKPAPAVAQPPQPTEATQVKAVTANDTLAKTAEPEPEPAAPALTGKAPATPVTTTPARTEPRPIKKRGALGSSATKAKTRYVPSDI